MAKRKDVKDYGIPKGPTSPKRAPKSAPRTGAFPGSAMKKTFVPSDSTKYKSGVGGYRVKKKK